MNNLNLFEMDKSQNLPSQQFLIRKKQFDLNRLKRAILSKEYQFKSRSFIEDIEKRIFEDELGDLYLELIKPYRDSQYNSEL